MKLRPDKFYAAWELRPLLTPDLILPQFGKLQKAQNY